MRLIAFPFPKEKINRRNVTTAAIVVLAIILVIAYIWLQNTGRLSQFNLSAYMQKLTAGIGTIAQRNGIENEVAAEDLEITLPSSAAGTYVQTADKGEGITHLARKALKEYMQATGQGADLTAEHKIYVEDYLQNMTGNEWLELGETVSFSGEMIKEAIEKSRQLTEQQLQNLKQFSSQVPSL